jgi:hypothetical protein
MGWYGDNPDDGDPNEESEGEYLERDGDHVQFVDLRREHRHSTGKQAKKRKQRGVARPRPEGTHYYPQTDDEARLLIQKLDHYRWETHKVTGSFSHDPYWLTAEIDGELHTIHLVGRFGTVLGWLSTRRP